MLLFRLPPMRLALSFALVALALSSCRGGCRSKSGSDRVDERMSLVPSEARFVVALDLAKIRESPLWKQLSDIAAANPQDRKILETFTARTGLDPLRQVHRVLVTFPDDARNRGQFGLIVDGERFDERSLVTYARDQASLDGARIEQRSRGPITIWSRTGGEPLDGFFLGTNRFVLAAGGWGDKMADLARQSPAARSARPHAEMMRLVNRVGGARAVWLAALVPADIRRALLADPSADTAASVTRMAAALDLGPGISADALVDLSNEMDAKALADRIRATLRDAKKNAALLMLGLGPYLDAIVVQAEGPSVRLGLALDEKQTEDLVSRAAGLARLAREKAQVSSDAPRQ